MAPLAKSVLVEPAHIVLLPPIFITGKAKMLAYTVERATVEVPEYAEQVIVYKVAQGKDMFITEPFTAAFV